MAIFCYCMYIQLLKQKIAMILTEPTNPPKPTRSDEHIAVLQREFGYEKTQQIIEDKVRAKFTIDRMSATAINIPIESKK